MTVPNIDGLREMLQSQIESHLAADADRDPLTEAPASPEEGAELIRAFMRVKQPEVRAAIIELTMNLSA